MDIEVCGKLFFANFEGDEINQEARLRELRAQARVQKRKCELRLKLTKEAGCPHLST